MGPRSGERGERERIVRRPAGEELASMGPRSGERGETVGKQGEHLWDCASMGPRSGERGEMIAAPELLAALELQWGRARVSAESRPARTRPWRSCSFNGAALG